MQRFCIFFARRKNEFCNKGAFLRRNKGESEGKIPLALGHPIGASGALLAHDFARKV